MADWGDEVWVRMRAHPTWPVIQATLDRFAWFEQVPLSPEETEAELRRVFEGPSVAVDGRTGAVQVWRHTDPREPHSGDRRAA